MRFIGNKDLIIPEIISLIKEKGLANKQLTFFDAFCGTGVVSDSVKDLFNVVANDMLNWCVAYTRGRTTTNLCTFSKLGFDPFDYFNSNSKTLKGFFYKKYSPGGSDRMYFTPENAGRIDYFRKTIEDWKNLSLIDENEYSHLLACLIESVSVVSNTAGVYGAFLKHWDSRALKPITFKRIESNILSNKSLKFYNGKIEDIISEVDCDILYLDPPYTQNQYGTQYHLLETLILNDKPKISNITGSRKTTPMRSDWSMDYKSHILFDKLIAKTKAKYVIFSYSKDGFMSKSFIEACLKRYGKPETYICKKISYRKYTNFKSREKNDHYEYLFFVERKNENEVEYESPLNYIGSKAKMISSLKKRMPEKINTVVDAFGGGFNVGINCNANKIIYNDLNHFVKELVESFKIHDTYQYILYIKRIINKYGLEPKKANSYLKVRDHYNSQTHAKRDPRLLYTVILYGFNQQIRFNGDHDFNNPVGMRWFNDKVLEKMISFSRVIKEKNIVFYSKHYHELYKIINNNTFVYFDPPYMLTTGSYNDGKRGFQGWNRYTERNLFDFVDLLNSEGKAFMISYVMEHGGNFNEQLDVWTKRKGYNVIKVDPIVGNKRKEILITNYLSNVEDKKATLRNKKQIPETIGEI